MDFRGKNVICTFDDNSPYFEEGVRYYIDSDGDLDHANGYSRFRPHSENDGTGFVDHAGFTPVFRLDKDLVKDIQVVATNRNFPTKKVNMIKRIREATQLGLKESKEIADLFTFDIHTPSTQEVVVTIPNRVYDQAAWRDVFRHVAAEEGETYQEIQRIAAECVGKKEFFFAKRLIQLLEEYKDRG